jgi:hypothetical protein
MEREINVMAIKDIIQRYKINVTSDTLRYQLVGRSGEASVILLDEELKQLFQNGELDDEIIERLIQRDVKRKFDEQGERIKALTSMKSAATAARAAHAFMRPLRKKDSNSETSSDIGTLEADPVSASSQAAPTAQVNPSEEEYFTDEVRRLLIGDGTSTQAVYFQGTTKRAVYFKFGADMEAVEAEKNLHVIPGYLLSETDKLWLGAPANASMEMPAPFFQAFLSAYKNLAIAPLNNQNYDEVHDLPEDDDESVDEPDVDPNMIAALQDVMNALHVLAKKDTVFRVIQTNLQRTAAREGIMLDVPRETHVATPPAAPPTPGAGVPVPSPAAPATTPRTASPPVPVSPEEHLRLLQQLDTKLKSLLTIRYVPAMPPSVSDVLQQLQVQVTQSIPLVAQQVQRLELSEERAAQADTTRFTKEEVLPENDGDSSMSTLTAEYDNPEDDDLEDDFSNKPNSSM